ncbi:hypothetical protein KBAHV01_09890 [Aeromonas hydrophila]|nr:hypothetical protein KBAHV01_09890 [Aeromonas hydrophila]
MKSRTMGAAPTSRLTPISRSASTSDTSAGTPDFLSFLCPVIADLYVAKLQFKKREILTLTV